MRSRYANGTYKELAIINEILKWQITFFEETLDRLRVQLTQRLRCLLLRAYVGQFVVLHKSFGGIRSRKRRRERWNAVICHCLLVGDL